MSGSVFFLESLEKVHVNLSSSPFFLNNNNDFICFDDHQTRQDLVKAVN